MGKNCTRVIRELFTLFVIVYLLQLILRLQPLFAFGAALLCLGYYPLFLRQREKKAEALEQFEEASLYLDTILYAFDREGKILQAYEAAAQSFPPGRLRQRTLLAIHRMQLISEGHQVVEEALLMMERLYPCRRIHLLHRFMLQVEAYGGNIHTSIALMQEDKCRWEKRIRSQIRDRRDAELQIVLSVVASMLICSVVLYMPSMRVEISKNVLVQTLALMVLLANECILLKGGTYRTCDWLSLDERKPSKKQRKREEENRMHAYRSYDEAKASRFSLWLTLIPAALTGPALYFHRQWLFAALLLLMLLFGNQHRIGHALAARSLKQELLSAFPGWLMDMILLLQGDNVMVALEKSTGNAEPVLQSELEQLQGRLQLEPESALAYHSFLQEFDLPQVHAAMSMLYSLSMGNVGTEGELLTALIDMNLEMQDLADGKRMKDQASGMYLLFLAPILTASLKLLVDMAIFLMGFLGAEVMIG